MAIIRSGAAGCISGHVAAGAGLLVLVSGLEARSAGTGATNDSRRPTVVMFAPPEAEISKLTDRDISVQDFLAYWIEIRRSIRRELPSLLVIESDAETITVGGQGISRRKTARGFGFILYVPSRGVRVLEGVLKPDAFLQTAHEYFDATHPPAPVTPENPHDDIVPTRPEPEILPPAQAPPESPLPLVPPFAGTWRGSVHQYRAPPYSVLMSLRPGPPGTRVGSVSYPELNCSGRVQLLKTSPTLVLLAERIEAGPCVDRGTIALTISGPHLGDWKWYDSTGHQEASARLTWSIDSSQRRSTPTRIVGTVRSIDLIKHVVLVARDDLSQAEMSASTDAATRYRGFEGLRDGQTATITGFSGLAAVHAADRVEIQGLVGQQGLFLAGSVTLLGRPRPAPARAAAPGIPLDQSARPGPCSDFNDAGTLPFPKKFYMTLEVFGIDERRLMALLASKPWLPHKTRILSVNEPSRTARAQSDWVPGAQKADDGRAYEITFHVEPTGVGVKLSMEIDLLLGQFCTNGNAKAVMCETLTWMASVVTDRWTSQPSTPVMPVVGTEPQRVSYCK